MEENDFGKTMGIVSDFQERANNFEENSRWVTDNTINSVPLNFLSNRKELGNVLDAGGGTGYLSYYLIRKLPVTKVTIVDASINMLQKACNRIPDALIVNETIEVYCGKNNKKFDTILARQIFHYVDDVDLIVRLLREKLKDDGILYVGQFTVHNKKSGIWNDCLMNNISTNRKRSLIVSDFVDLFIQNGFKILEFCTTNYQENLKDFYKRRTTNRCTYGELMKNMMEFTDKSVGEKMNIKIMDNNMFFDYPFCHLMLAKK